MCVGNGHLQRRRVVVMTVSCSTRYAQQPTKVHARVCMCVCFFYKTRREIETVWLYLCAALCCLASIFAAWWQDTEMLDR